jgi:hypothetical protein
MIPSSILFLTQTKTGSQYANDNRAVPRTVVAAALARATNGQTLRQRIGGFWLMGQVRREWFLPFHLAVTALSSF